MGDLFLTFKYKIKNKYKYSKLKTQILQCAGVFLTLMFLIKTGDLVNTKLLVAPFGASCVILFGFPDSKFSNAKNIIWGYFICASIGAGMNSLLGSSSLEIAFAVSLAVFIMLLTNIMHPPAAAITMIAMSSGSGWTFVLVPVLLGAFVIVGSSIIYNKLHKKLSGNIFVKSQLEVSELETSN